MLSWLGCVNESVLNPVDFPEIIIPSSTVIIPADDWYAVYDSISSQDSVLVTDISLLEKYPVQQGQIIAVPGDSAFLRKVKAVVKQDPRLLFTVDSASLADAMQRGRGHWQSKLGNIDAATVRFIHPGVVLDPQSPVLSMSFSVLMDDADGDSATSGDQVLMQGSLRLDGFFDFSLFINDHAVRQCVWQTAVNQDMNATFICQQAATLNKREKIVSIQYGAIEFSAGTLPIVIAPTITIWLGMEGSIGGAVKSTVMQQSFTRTGLELMPSGEWSPTSEFKSIATTTGPTSSKRTSLNTYIEVSVCFPIYQYVGPSLRTIMTHELTIDPSSSRKWELYVDARAEVGMKSAILQSDLIEFFRDDVMTYRKKIAQGS